MNLDAAMQAAIEQAEQVKGRTYPNPPVGAVILDRDGQIAGVGATSPAGGPHAEPRWSRVPRVPVRGAAAEPAQL